MVLSIAVQLDSLLLRGVSGGPCFGGRTRCRKHARRQARRHARPCNGLKQGPALTPRNNRLSHGKAMVLSIKDCPVKCAKVATKVRSYF